MTGSADRRHQAVAWEW